MERERQVTITGLSCAGCVAAAQEALKKTKGVKVAEVQLLEGRTRLVYDSAVVSDEELRQAVREIGYDMLLESSAMEREAQYQSERQRALRQLRTKLIVTIILTILVMLLGMWHDAVGLSALSANRINFILASVIYFYAGGGYHLRALKQLRHATFTMDTLISISTTVAYLFSTARLFLPEGSSAQAIFGASYFDMIGMILSFVLVGKYIEERAKHRTQDALRKLQSLAPERAQVRRESGEISDVPVADLHVGDVILLRHGDRVPVDGILLERGSFDESSITGEPLPVEKLAGEEVFSGTLSVGGATSFRATTVGEATLLGRIVEAVRRAQASKAPIQRLADKISGIFVPIVLVIAVLTLVGWGFFSGSSEPWLRGLYFMITVLVIACPCALGLATPTAVTVAMGRASEKGLLIRDAAALERLSQVTDVIYDKTGTLTEGTPKVVDALWLGRTPDAISLLVAAERQSSHPLAKAIVEAYNNECQEELLPENIVEVPSGGLSFSHSGAEYRIGSRQYVTFSSKPEVEDFEQKNSSSTLSYFTRNGELIAVLALDDALRPDTKDAINRLQSHLRVHLLSGDRSERVEYMAREVGVRHAVGGLSPLEKKKYIDELQKEGAVVAMVGDGINDSPALATADVSVAIGSGSDIANDVAMLTSISGSPYALERAIALSKRTVRIIKENFFWAFIYNLVALPIATGLFFPTLFISPMVGAGAMAGSSIIVVLNSLRLRKA